MSYPGMQKDFQAELTTTWYHIVSYQDVETSCLLSSEACDEDLRVHEVLELVVRCCRQQD